MSSIDSLKLISPVGGETTYTSPTTDMKNMNSLSYSALYAHASLPIANLELLFSVDDINFEVYETITLQNEVKTTYNSVIPSRYFRFKLSNPSPDAMVETNIIFYAHSSATQNIDVNLSSPHDTIDVSGNFALETTQLAVKGVLDDISLNTLSLYNLDKRTFNLPRSGLVLHNSVAVSADTTSTQFIIGENDDDLTSKDIYNTIQINGRVPFDSSYSCVLEFSNDGVNYFSDHIEPDIKRLGTSAYKTFSLTRTNVCSTYARVYHLQSATELFLQASLMRY
jgi:hypothetical protein